MESNERPPSVEFLARSLDDLDLPQPLLVNAAREAIAAGKPSEARTRAEAMARSLLQPVINATGVLLHTNLGRAPIAVEVDARPTNLELSLADGFRGSRHAGVGGLFAQLCGAEDAIVVNNGAAAILLATAALAEGREVAVSRGESVEIGGGFRIPDVVAQSGARLVDVGTTNRTTADDYRSAIAAQEADIACVLRVHRSNFTIEGFTASPTLASLVELDVPVLVDLGSGLIDASCPWLPGAPPSWLAREPAVRQVLDDGAALATFSGDKLLGGPQAGVIVGQADLVARCARHPLARALRPGSLVLLTLQDVALAYLRRDLSRLPFWRQATTPTAELRRRAERIAESTASAVRAIEDLAVEESQAVPGAGTAPGTTIASVALTLPGDHRVALRHQPTPIIAHVTSGRTWCDLRTVEPGDDHYLAEALGSLLQ